MSAHPGWDWQFPVSSIPALASALLLAVLTVVLLRVCRGRRDVVALALLLGAGTCASALAFTFDGFIGTYATSVTLALTQVFWMIDAWLWACFAMMLLAERTQVPRVLAAFPTYLVPALSLGALVIWKPGLVYDYSGFLSASLTADAPPGSFPLAQPRALSIVDRVTDSLSPIFALVLAWWALRREKDEVWSSILLVALAAAGVRLFHVTNTFVYLFSQPLDPWWTAVGSIFLISLGSCLVLVALLVHEGIRGHVKRRGFARGGAAFLVLVGAAALWLGLTPTTSFAFPLFLTFATLMFPVISTYALLRHRLLGLDVKLRFAISRSTIAAVFITVFFVASEGAQIVFGRENDVVGLFAAAALVFAIAPLQRAAERLAEKAVPATPGTTALEAKHLTAYRLAVEVALRDDGRLTSREETHLADLAQALGVGAGDALRMRREIETRATIDGRESR